MSRMVASLTLGFAAMAATAFSAQPQGPTLGSPTTVNQAELPPPPLSSVPTSLPPVVSDPSATGTTVLKPVPEVQYDGPVTQLPVVTTPVTMFDCVKVRDPRKIAPCAVPIIVAVPDPCTPADRCNCTPRPCVYVEICVPNTGCPKVCVTRCGNKTRYDYGKYAVEIISRNGKVIVDYDA